MTIYIYIYFLSDIYEIISKLLKKYKFLKIYLNNSKILIIKEKNLI